MVANTWKTNLMVPTVVYFCSEFVLRFLFVCFMMCSRGCVVSLCLFVNMVVCFPMVRCFVQGGGQHIGKHGNTNGFHL